ncbi:MAG: hypothetical protein AAF483_03195 [Planctomycetota bacterium]
MALKDEVFGICQQLGPKGWTDLLKKVTNDQLNLDQVTADALEQNLLQPIAQLLPNATGFGDFSQTDPRGISPGNPAGSLLYHALCSPLVTAKADGSSFAGDEFASPEQLAAIENYIFALRNATLSQLRATWLGNRMAIVVFTSSYRPAGETVHRKHADLCFSRTGVGRVGTRAAKYDPVAREYTMVADGEPDACRVVPVRFSAWIAVKLQGAQGEFGPMRPQQEDQNREFWVPVHKLFDGDECLQGRTVKLDFKESHLNEKIRYLHEELLARSVTTGHSLGDLVNEPFTLQSDKIASIESASGLLTPIHHAALVDEASDAGGKVTYRVPRAGSYSLPGVDPLEIGTFFSSLEARVEGPGGLGSRPLPEYAHARTRIVNGQERDLNETRNVSSTVGSGRYQALHYLDFAGDGSVSVDPGSLATEFSTYSAYSLVSAPDFFPFVSQRELSDWPRGRDIKWNITPDVLCDTRLPANFRSHSKFEDEQTRDGQTLEDTITSIVSIPQDPKTQVTQVEDHQVARISTLPDGAAGVFAPGWDVSRDTTNGIDHLSAYGLGTPFPEDAKLCAALSSFWPAVAPDITRVYWPNAQESIAGQRTIVPLTDDEVGAIGGAQGWDGDQGPRLDPGNGTVTYKEIAYVDYVISSVDNKFDYSRLATLDSAQYKARITCLDAARQTYLGDVLRTEMLAVSPARRRATLLALIRTIDRRGRIDSALHNLIVDLLDAQTGQFALRPLFEVTFVQTLQRLGASQVQAMEFVQRLPIPLFDRVVSVNRTVTREELAAMALTYLFVSFRQIPENDPDYVAARNGDAPVADAISHRLVFVRPGRNQNVDVDVNGTMVPLHERVDIASASIFFSDGVNAWQG